MRIPVIMPKAGYDMTNGTIVGWTKQVGEHVKRGDVIAEIETDKAIVEMEALSDGELVEIVHPAGAVVPVGEPIAYLEDQ
jgi:pyruvate dehydrogenase E2 component (dihydrolipoamide acetyltransferase)